MTLSIGSLLADRYEITAPIAVGGMGEVWQARDRVLGRIVAAKVLRSEYTGDPNFLARFRNEARHTAGLTHQNIASVYDYGETFDGTGHQPVAFLVMEFVEGQPLVTILHEEGRLPVDWTLHVLSQSADGLSAAHRAGVVHRDIKPGNLIVRPDGVVKLTDFGIAQARDATPLTRTGMVVGTAQYLSPEQAQGLEVTAASDVYSLGVVAYECLAGSRPFDGASQVAIALAHINRPPPPLPADVPPAVRLLVERALAKEPTDRFPDGGEFAEAIRRVAAGGSLAAAPGTAPTPAAGHDQGDDHGGTAVEGRTQVFGAATSAAVAAAPRSPARGTGPAGPMPPLQAADDDDWPPAEDDPARRRRRLLPWLAAAVVLVLVALGAWFLLDPAGDAGPEARGTTTATSATGTPGTTAIDLQTYLGRPAEQVRVELGAQNFDVVLAAAPPSVVSEGSELAGRELAAGQVAGIDPTGAGVSPGARVTLYVVPPPAGDDAEPTDADEPDAEPTDADEPDAEPTDADEPGTGSGPAETTTGSPQTTPSGPAVTSRPGETPTPSASGSPSLSGSSPPPSPTPEDESPAPSEPPSPSPSATVTTPPAESTGASETP